MRRALSDWHRWPSWDTAGSRSPLAWSISKSIKTHAAGLVGSCSAQVAVAISISRFLVAPPDSELLIN